MLNYIFEQFAIVARFFLSRLVTFQSRPLLAKNFHQKSDDLKKQPLIGIVIQGSILRNNNFTFETIKIYQKIFPSQPIILSTWEDEDQEQLALLSSLKIHLVLNKKPLNPGIKHINYQITSSYKGIMLARKLRCNYVFKTRTDQRIYGINLLEFCLNMLKQFPVAAGFKQKERILVPSFYTFKYRLYSVTDMILFGHIDDMETYFDAKHDARKSVSAQELNKIKTVRQLAKVRWGETYLSVSFLRKVGREIKWTLADSWQAYAEHFCVVDQNIFDIYWPKYNCPLEYRHLNYECVTNKQELTFREWINLYVGLNNKTYIPEQTLDKGIDEVALISLEHS